MHVAYQKVRQALISVSLQRIGFSTSFNLGHSSSSGWDASTSQGYPQVFNLLVPIYSPGWWEAVWERSDLSKTTTQHPRPGLELRPLDPQSCAVTMHLPTPPLLWWKIICTQQTKKKMTWRPANELFWGSHEVLSSCPKFISRFSGCQSWSLIGRKFCTFDDRQRDIVR